MSEFEKYSVDTLVIGAGVVGLAVARELALQGREVWILEQASEFGSGTSSRNSEVIHAGIYYPQGSLKAQLCLEGKALLYDYCCAKSLSAHACGKLIVASNEVQEGKLEQILAHAADNGVNDLKRLSGQQALALESNLSCTGAVLSPSTGIVDSHSLMQNLLWDAEAAGAVFVPNTQVKLHSCSSGEFVAELENQAVELTAKELVNAAGLSAMFLLQGVDGFPTQALPSPYYAKGSYFAYSGNVPFTRLIYPVPEEGGLGVHLTLDMAGMGRFGPDVEWIGALSAEQLAQFDYGVDEAKKHQFCERIREYWPEVDDQKLHAAYSGLRPKIKFDTDQSGVYSDFCIQCPEQHGVQGLVNLFGIESPGLTSCLAIAKRVASKL